MVQLRELGRFKQYLKNYFPTVVMIWQFGNHSKLNNMEGVRGTSQY